MEQKQLTVKEALEQGYTLCGFANEDCQSLKRISKLTAEDWEHADYTRGVLLAEKDGYNYTITADRISDLITEYISDQDEVADENGELAELACEADFKTLADDINSRLSKKSYHDLTEIILVK